MIAIFFVGQVGWYFGIERFSLYRSMENPTRGLYAMVTAAIERSKSDGKHAMMAHVREVLQRELPRLEKHLNTIAVMAGAAPLLGLAGTVAGIMDTFHVITDYGVGNPAMLAGGIAQALMVTEAGLVVAFPLLIVHDRLQIKLDRIEDSCVEGATRMIHAVEGKSA